MTDNNNDDNNKMSRLSIAQVDRLSSLVSEIDADFVVIPPLLFPRIRDVEAVESVETGPTLALLSSVAARSGM